MKSKMMAQAIRNYTSPPPDEGAVEEQEARAERARTPRNLRAQGQIAKNARPPQNPKGPARQRMPKAVD